VVRSLFLSLISIIIGLFQTPQVPAILPLPSPTPYQFPYQERSHTKNRSYRIALVGDSIVYALGPNANQLREKLIKYYPDNEFVNYNFGFPSTSVASLYDRLNDTILKVDTDLIIIESFGNNPLSEYPLTEGLKKQTEELEKSVRLILSQMPHTSLAFMTPIALDPVNYGRGTVDLAPQVRQQWVDERVAYINNHKQFALDKGIPLIDVYSLSLLPSGSVNRIYISDDAIHPSKAGVELISRAIADYIFTHKVFPFLPEEL
jgi:lysophospholipase L1-like esterase